MLFKNAGPKDCAEKRKMWGVRKKDEVWQDWAQVCFPNVMLPNHFLALRAFPLPAIWECSPSVMLLS